MTPENSYRKPSGHIECRACRAESSKLRGDAWKGGTGHRVRKDKVDAPAR